ncbi:hypothetical protein Hanom_Chr07g00582421 [Helianthus anomalus]
MRTPPDPMSNSDSKSWKRALIPTRSSSTHEFNMNNLSKIVSTIFLMNSDSCLHIGYTWIIIVSTN